MPGKTADTETLAIGYFDDARAGLEQWADAVAKQYDIHLKPQPVGYCTWYAEKHGGSADEKSLAELTDFAAKNLEPFGFNFVQIDDHWQLGMQKKGTPKKNFTGHNPDGPYPHGMKGTADERHQEPGGDRGGGHRRQPDGQEFREGVGQVGTGAGGLWGQCSRPAAALP